MNKIISICVLVVGAGSIICVSAFAPRWIDDHNDFLKGFVNHELLAILGVILAITLASASQIHLKFNDIEEKVEKEILKESRKEVERSCYFLIGAFVAATILVVIKPLFVEHQFAVAALNGFSVWILLFNIMVLFDITSGIFSIGPIIKR